MSSKPRLSIETVDPSAQGAVLELERYVRAGAVPASLVHLVKIRASQLNGCAFCLDLEGYAKRRLLGRAAGRRRFRSSEVRPCA